MYEFGAFSGGGGGGTQIIEKHIYNFANGTTVTKDQADPNLLVSDNTVHLGTPSPSTTNSPASTPDFDGEDYI